MRDHDPKGDEDFFAYLSPGEVGRDPSPSRRSKARSGILGVLAIVVLLALVAGTLFVITAPWKHRLVRNNEVHIWVTANPTGTWDPPSCNEPIHDLEAQCEAGRGSAAFMFKVQNLGQNPTALSDCFAIPVGTSGQQLPEVRVPVELTGGVPYVLALVDRGQTLTLPWFAAGRSPAEVVSYRATCRGVVNRGPYPVCLVAGDRIATPSGPVAVEDIRQGTVVWSENRSGGRIRATVIRTSKVPVPPGHEVATVALADGRSLTASLGHPTSDGRTLGAISPGDHLGGSDVVSVKVSTYSGYTYDLLPSGPTGTYFVNGVHMGSTLFHGTPLA